MAAHAPTRSTAYADQPPRSPWLAQLAQDGPPRPLDGDVTNDVAVVGAGIAGVATAFFILRHTGHYVLLVERGRVARGATGRSAGQTTTYFERPLSSIADEYGVQPAVEAQRGFDAAHDLFDLLIAESGAYGRFERFDGHMGRSTSITSRSISAATSSGGRVAGGPSGVASPRRRSFSTICRPSSTVSTRSFPRRRSARSSRSMTIATARCCPTSRAARTAACWPSRCSATWSATTRGGSASSITLTSPTSWLARTGPCSPPGITSWRRDPCPLHQRLRRPHRGRHGGHAGSAGSRPGDHRAGGIHGRLRRARAAIARGYELRPQYENWRETACGYVTRRTYERPEDIVTLSCMGGPEDPVYSPDAPFPGALLTEMDDSVRPFAQPTRAPRLPYDFQWHRLMGYNDSGIRVVGAHAEHPSLFYNLAATVSAFFHRPSAAIGSAACSAARRSRRASSTRAQPRRGEGQRSAQP